TAARAGLGVAHRVPHWPADMPRAAAGSRRRPPGQPDPAVVFFASCLNPIFAPASGGGGASAPFYLLVRRAGLDLDVPRDIDRLCCAMPWRSKGLTRGAEAMSERVAAALWRATDGGTGPVVTDAASCTHGLLDAVADRGLTVIDSTAF